MSSRLLTSAFMRSAASRKRLRDLGMRRRQRRRGELQRIGHAGQRRQRRAQVVRDRAQQRVAQPLRLHLHRRLLRDVDVVDALQRDRQQRREGVEQPALLRHVQPLRIAQRQRDDAAHAHRRLQRHVEHRAGRQRAGALPRGLGVRQRPVREAGVDARSRVAARRGGRRRRAAGTPRAPRTRPAARACRSRRSARASAPRRGRATARTARARDPRAAWPRAPGTSGRR